MFVHQITIAFLRKRFSAFDKLRGSTSIMATIINFNLDFWLTIPPIVVSVSLTLEDNIKLFMSLLSFGLSLIVLSCMMDGASNAIVRPFWIGNERKAYNVISNKKIIHLLKGESKGDAKAVPENVIINI